ncbi:MAG: vitamin K epoxide reductase family protein [Myxococcota bacterium]
MSEYPIIYEDDRSGSKPPVRADNPIKGLLFGVAGASGLGAIFAGLSTSDFVNHLDRQVHQIHCSFIPGAGAELGESGCRTVMMSPYSSLFRESMWGGLPISLWALAVFAYLIFRSTEFALRPSLRRKETLFLVAATGLPLMMSLIYGTLAAVKVGAMCKLCVGVYLASMTSFGLALAAHLKLPEEHGYDPSGPPYARWFGEGVLYVAVMTVLYMVAVPTSDKSLKGCGTLAKKDDPHGIMVPLSSGKGGTPAVAVLDPLCPACKAFEDRLDTSGLVGKLSLNAVLFPLDASCNWMVKESLHPGACAVSEAMLCDKDGADQILAWAFEHQEELRGEAAKDEAKLRRRLGEVFPKVKGCVGSAAIKNKVNKSLRWAVANALPVLTPQLFVGDRRVCDEDTDLGLEYTLAAMLADPGKSTGKGGKK